MKRFLGLGFGLSVALGLYAQTRSVVAIGTSANDSTGDSLRSAFTKANANFSNLWSAVYTNGTGGGGGTNYLFDANWFSVSGTNVTLATSVTLTNGWTLNGGTTNNITLLSPTLALQGSSGLNLKTPAVYGSTAGLGYVLTLLNTTTGQAEWVNPGFLGLSGGTMSGAINLGGYILGNMGTPSASTDGATKGYVDTKAALYVPLAGGTMSGVLNMGSQKISALATPTTGSDAATAAYAEDLSTSSVMPPTMTVWDDGTNVFARMPYGTVSATAYDLVLRMYRSHPLSGNRNFNYDKATLVPSSNRVGDISTGNIDFDTSMTDDVGPLNFSGRGNSGGNHSFEGSLVTKTAHGITGSDVGKRWADSSGRNWRLLAVPSVNTLYFAAQADASGYTRAAVTTGGTLTSLDGAANVATSFTSTTGAMSSDNMTDPNGRWIRDRTLSILADGVELQQYEYRFQVRQLVIRDKYNLPRHDNVYTECTTTSPVLSNVTAGFSINREFRIYGWGQMSCIEFDRVIGGNYSVAGITTGQANQITMVSPYTTRWRWFPGAASSGPGSLDLSVPANHTSAPAGDPVWLHSSHSANSGFAPDGHLEFATSSSASLTAGTSLIGRWIFMDSEAPESGITARASNMTSSGAGYGSIRITSSTGKVYPNGTVTVSGFMNANDSVRLAWHRRYFQPQSSGPIAVVWVRQADDRWTIRAAWQAAHGVATIAVPAWLNGRVASSVYIQGGALQSSRVVSGGLTINCSSSPGFADIRLAPRNL